MAVTLSVAQLAAALRLNDSADETAKVTRLLGYVSVAIVNHAPSAPDVAHNEAARRLAGYLLSMLDIKAPGAGPEGFTGVWIAVIRLQ